MTILGIDLGTTNSLVAVLRDAGPGRCRTSWAST